MTVELSGATRIHFIVGDPIAQVKSPGGMSALFAARGHDALMIPIHVTSADLAEFVRSASLARNVDGIVATVPHKFACYRLCQSTTERAGVLEAVNIMRRRGDGAWHGDMVDGLGFVGAVTAKGFRCAGARALLLGAGGAGSAIGYALLDAGVRELAVHDLDTARRDALISRLSAKFSTRVLAGSDDPHGFDLVAHATTSGMRAGDQMPLKIERLSAHTFVGCVITAPPASPLIVAARAVGCKTSVGTDMYLALQDTMADFLLAEA